MSLHRGKVVHRFEILVNDYVTVRRSASGHRHNNRQAAPRRSAIEGDVVLGRRGQRRGTVQAAGRGSYWVRNLRDQLVADQLDFDLLYRTDTQRISQGPALDNDMTLEEFWRVLNSPDSYNKAKR